MKIRNLMAGAVATAGVISLVACTTNNENNNNGTSSVMTYSEYIAAQKGSEVTIDGYITDRCTWYNNAASFYLQDDNGGYYVYNLACTEAEYATLTVGKKLQITGSKSEWKGEVEIDYGTATENQKWEIVEGTKTYAATSVANIATATLDAYKNTKVSATSLTVTASSFTSWNDYSLTAKAGADVYFAVTDTLGNTLTFVVEAYLEDSQYGSDVYTAAASLKLGDVIDLEGFVYYYDAPQLQVTKITKKTNSTVNTYDEFVAAEKGTEVTIAGHITDKCTWYNNAASVYLQDNNHGYYIYNLACTQEEYNKLTVGTLLFVTGAKSEWKGELEIDYGTATENQGWDAKYVNYTYSPIKVTNIATTTLDAYKNCKIAIDAELTVTKVANDGGKWSDAENGYVYTNITTENAKAGQDLYITVKDANDNELVFVVEAYLADSQFGSDVYNTVLGLKLNDKVKLEGFVYYWNLPQLQINKCTKVN